MNEGIRPGQGRVIVGKVKGTAGDGTGDSSLQGEGLADHLSRKVQKVVGAAKALIAADGELLLAKARSFRRELSFASGAPAGGIGLALLNTRRGKR